jgi:hypothetical protein
MKVTKGQKETRTERCMTRGWANERNGKECGKEQGRRLTNGRYKRNDEKG